MAARCHFHRAATRFERPTTSAGAGSRLPVRGRVIRGGRFSHAAFRTRSFPRAPRPGRTVRVLPSSPSGGALGVLPFAGLLPPAGGRAGYQSRGSACDIAALRCAPASHALRASLLVRAHVPVDRVIPSAPRLIFVGEAPSSDDTPGTFDSIRLLGFVPAGGPFRRLPMTSSSARRRSFLPWALPLSGLSVTPRIRRFRRSWLCVLAGGHDPACRIISLRPTDLPPAYPLVGVTASFPVARVRRRHSVVEALALPAGAASSRRNSPALQRVVGLMPGRSDEPRDPSDRLPV